MLYLIVVIGVLPIELYNKFTIVFIPAVYLIGSLKIISYWNKNKKPKIFINTYKICAFLATICILVVEILFSASFY